jgi:O-antigen biosynthesis protein
MRSFQHRCRHYAGRVRDILRESGPAGLLEKILDSFGERLIPDAYRYWIFRYDRLGRQGRRALTAEIAGWKARPSISVLLTAGQPDLPRLAAAVRSVERQLYPAQELCIVLQPAARAALPGLAAGPRKLRIEIADGAEHDGRAAALNRALKLATGDFIVLMDADAELSEQALYWLAKAAIAHPDAALVFTDEDAIDQRGRRFDPWFKPDWNPALMLSCNAFGRVGAYRRSLVERLGGFRPGFDGAEDHDLVLRCALATGPAGIRHVARVLYHRRARDGAKREQMPPAASEAGRRAVEAYMNAAGIRATVTRSAVGYQVDYAPPPRPPRVSVLVPTTGEPSLLEPCLTSLLRRTTYPSFEVVILINAAHRGIPERAALLDRLAGDARVRVLDYPDRPFNYSWVNNRGAEKATGEVLCLLNDDTEVITAGWLEKLVARVTLAGVAAAGPMLLYPEDTIQHAGVILGVGGVATHALRAAPRGHPGYFGNAAMERDVACVTAGCMAIGAQVFRDLGGFNEELAIAFNDVDLCLRLRAAGWRIVWTPAVELRHREFASLGRHDAPERAARFAMDVAWMRRRWGPALDDDPFYNRNLSLRRPYQLAFPPRLRDDAG